MPVVFQVLEKRLFLEAVLCVIEGLLRYLDAEVFLPAISLSTSCWAAAASGQRDILVHWAFPESTRTSKVRLPLNSFYTCGVL
jgi:hypothetical protein